MARFGVGKGLAVFFATAAISATVGLSATMALAKDADFPGKTAIPSGGEVAAKWGPIIPGAHFHHVQMNVKSRDASIAWYLARLPGMKTKYIDGQEALWVQRSWILFNEVPTPAPLEAGTAIMHYGWGNPDVPAEFARQKSLGTTFNTEMRDISTGMGGDGAKGKFYFMYLKGPDGEIIEVNTDADTNFGHIHMTSADPKAAEDWYKSMFGIVETAPYFASEVTNVGSGHEARFFLDNVNMIIVQARPGSPAIRATTGSVADSIGVSVPNLDRAMAAVRAHKVTVLQEPMDGPGQGNRHAMIEGPDKMAIELIEDHGAHPPVTNAPLPTGGEHVWPIP
jgi:catechol 2,3-dioxygenase-like lactoylglutathione lyase family enzyme